jgi:hypothetical protein
MPTTRRTIARAVRPAAKCSPTALYRDWGSIPIERCHPDRSRSRGVILSGARDARGVEGRIVAFYEGSAPDDRGRFLPDVLRFDDNDLERVHDFIQWLFPLPERSGANPSAPILDDAAIDAFHRRPELRAALRRSFDRMLAFYGFAWSGDRIVPSQNFSARSGWLTPSNHNHLRLTRILRSLTILGERGTARALFDALAKIYNEERRTRRNRISEASYRFWTEAVQC